MHSPGVITLKLISLLLQIQPELKVPILIAVAAGLGKQHFSVILRYIR